MQADLVSVHQPPRAARKILFLVHGTYAKHAGWVRPGSGFCEQLLQDLGPDVSVQAFVWSGRNSVGAREQAASRLRELLQESIARSRKVPHVVIGHSHGGNVALRAVNCPQLGKVRAICLSTPFIHPIPRRELTDSKTFVWLMSAIPVVIILALFLWLDSVLRTMQPHWLLGIVTGAWLPLAVFFCLLSNAALAKSRDIAIRTVKLIEINDCAENRVLFLRFAGDEGSLALTTFQAMQYAMNSFFKTILSIFAALVSLSRKLLDSNWALIAVLVPFVLSLVAYGLKWTTVSTWLIAPLGLGVLIGLLGLVFIVFLSVCALVMGLLSILVAIPAFGLRLALASFWVELCVEASPFGQANTVVLTPSAESVAAGLRHSFCYQEEPAIRAIVRYLAEPHRRI